ncbi:conjugal transfer pilus assembly protein TraW [Pseudoduganella lurida]|uniref:Conjugal transfer pilus assembly protein TraW n=1 Tax=Pseudoduganella lurida TaxID=1036180 RepID=A0A562RJQ5_9BURK|nr:type-F conjugative transfer system protein TraW [Pseudoduganella lurida]TWI69295.1 conjugal transfer pilus assembly protein TraW [Pseudoduganella lurida]
MNCSDRLGLAALAVLTGAAFVAPTVPAVAVARTVAPPAAALTMAAPLVIGPVYPIGEEDMLAWIDQRLAQKQADGSIAIAMRSARERAHKALRHPDPVTDIAKATSSRTRHVDPSVTAQTDHVDVSGRVLVARGSRINPLDTVRLARPLIFLDARDPDQVAFARKFIDGRDGAPRPVLVAGSPFELMERWQVPVYFDQNGTLVQRLGIRQVPAIVAQDGPRLRIDEIAL